MPSIFKRVPVYIKIKRNKVEITNLQTGETFFQEALEPFSTERSVVADFNKASEVINLLLQKIFPKKFLLPQQKSIVIQQVESVEGGLSQIEKRALRDLGEQAGGMPVILIDHFRALSVDEAIQELQKK
jgi:actin-like ATPase involved in cell morphogenesis